MYVSYEPVQVSLAIHQLGAMPSLEEMAIAVVLVVEGDRVTGEKSLHEVSQGNRPCPVEHVKVVGHQCPCQDAAAGTVDYVADSVKKIPPVTGRMENGSPIYASADDVMQSSIVIYSCWTSHTYKVYLRSL